MESLSHAISIADALKWHVDDTVVNGDKLEPLKSDEAKASDIARSKAFDSIDASIYAVSKALKSLKSIPSSNQSQRKSSWKFAHPHCSDKTTDHEVLENRDHSTRGRDIRSTNTEKALALFRSLDGKGVLDKQTKTLESMVDRARPIIETFDSVLKKPYLENFNATINTVPVLGIKDRNVMYIDKVAGSGTTERWSVFGKLPDDLHMASDKALHIFPFHGDLYISSGTAVWKKKCRLNDDPEVKKAIDNFPKLYYDSWTKVGENCLPAKDLISVVPFSVLSGDKEVEEFHLVILSGDNKASVFTGEELGSNSASQFRTMIYNSDGGIAQPTWLKWSYWNGSVCAYDNQNYTWDLKPNFTTREYTIKDKLQVSKMTEFTADDIGPIGVHANDDFLYKRYSKLQSDPNKEVDTEWRKWLPRDGVTNLGVASPGVMLNMRALTTTLRSRYVDTQSSLYSSVQSVASFARVHTRFLENAMEKAEIYWEATTPEEQKRLAEEQGKAYLVHAQIWSEMTHKNVSSGEASVYIMTKQLGDVRNQLERQLGALEERLIILKATLETNKEQLPKLKAAFWGMIATIFVGIAGIVLGIATGQIWLVSLGGLLAAGGIVAARAFGSQLSELSGKIAEIESQIRVCESAHTQLAAIIKDFVGLDESYDALNEFWGRLSNEASYVKDDSDSCIEMGMAIYKEKATVQAAKEANSRMFTGAQAYLDMLNKQGIKPRSIRLATRTTSHGRSQEITTNSLQFEATGEEEKAIAQLLKDLSNNDLAAYQANLAAMAMNYRRNSMVKSMFITAAGVWFDIAKLSSDSYVLIGRAAGSFVGPISVIPAIPAMPGMQESPNEKAKKLNSLLVTAKPQVINMLKQIVETGKICQDWAKRFPTIPDEQKLPEAKAIKQKALDACGKAMKTAQDAAGTFAEFNHEATAFENELHSQISLTEDNKKSVTAQHESRMDNIKVPWYVWSAGAKNVEAYKAEERAKIRNELVKALSGLDHDIKNLTTLLQSGLDVEGSAATWITMVQTVSGHLSGIYNILDGVMGQLLENPALYLEWINTDWTNINKDAQNVLIILGASLSRTRSHEHARPMPAIRGHGTSRSDKAQVLAAVRPSHQLGFGLVEQLRSLKTCFSSLDKLMRLPYTEDITGYWEKREKEDEERETLRNVISRLRLDYVQMVSTQYPAVQKLCSTALVQAKRIENVHLGKTDIEFFLELTLQDVRRANETIKSTQSRFGESAEKYRLTMARIEKNINENVAALESLDKNIDKLDKEIRDKMIWIIADTIALVFAGIGLLAAFGVIGSLTGGVAIGTAAGAIAATIATSLKLTLDSLSMSDLVQTVEALKSTVRILQTSVREMKTVQPLFKNVVKGMADIGSIMDDMEVQLSSALDMTQNWEGIKLTCEDVKVVQDSWNELYDDGQAWLDEVNREGINPIKMSIRPVEH